MNTHLMQLCCRKQDMAFTVTMPLNLLHRDQDTLIKQSQLHVYIIAMLYITKKVNTVNQCN